MFFVFYILVLVNYFADTSNYVLQRINQDVGRDPGSNDKHENFKEICNNTIELTTVKSLFEIARNDTNTISPNLKVNLFDRKLSDEMLSIKQHIFSRDASPKCKSTHLNSDVTLEIKQEWPAVDLLSKLDEIEKNDYKDGIEDFKFRHLFLKENHNTSDNVDILSKVKSFNDIIKQYNESKNKVVDLRSLSGHAPSHMKELLKAAPTFNSCTCSHNLRKSIWNTPKSEGESFPHEWTTETTVTAPHGCVECTRTTYSITLMPYYVPYDPNIYYPPNIYSMPDEYLYHDEDKDGEDTDCHVDHEKHHTRTTKNKNDWHEEDPIVDIDYDEPRDTKVKWNTAFFEARPDKLVKDLIDDLIRLYPDSVIKKCFCSSTSHSPSPILSKILFYVCLFCGCVIFYPS